MGMSEGIFCDSCNEPYSEDDERFCWINLEPPKNLVVRLHQFQVCLGCADKLTKQEMSSNLLKCERYISGKARYADYDQITYKQIYVQPLEGEEDE
ncbi:hypothetical protein [Bacillus phage YungSlug]|nr:hypothetical protein [Bacillus phage YungSlug]